MACILKGPQIPKFPHLSLAFTLHSKFLLKILILSTICKATHLNIKCLTCSGA